MTESLFSESGIDINMQLECVRREIRFRERVYARRVQLKKMSPQKAAYEIDAMKEVLQTLEAVKLLAEPGDHYDIGGDISLRQVRAMLRFPPFDPPPPRQP